MRLQTSKSKKIAVFTSLSCYLLLFSVFQDKQSLLIDRNRIKMSKLLLKPNLLVSIILLLIQTVRVPQSSFANKFKQM